MHSNDKEFYSMNVSPEIYQYQNVIRVLIIFICKFSGPKMDFPCHPAPRASRRRRLSATKLLLNVKFDATLPTASGLLFCPLINSTLFIFLVQCCPLYAPLLLVGILGLSVLLELSHLARVACSGYSCQSTLQLKGNSLTAPCVVVWEYFLTGEGSIMNYWRDSN